MPAVRDRMIPGVLTVRDYLKLPDDAVRYEILEGSLHVTPSPTTTHQSLSGRLQGAIYTHAVLTGQGAVFSAPTDLVLSVTSVVQPDLIYVARDRRRIITPRRLEGAPTLVVEVLSLSTKQRDETAKYALYAKHRIPYYWIVDPVGKTLREYALAGNTYGLVVHLGLGDVFVPKLFPGLTIALDDLFAPLFGES